ncbi:MAG: M20/M25/M40 family metallo-hydrolase [Thermoanaerobaculia bacterium]|nr:M20/M25/M40 family metallo-hydrolase [Thermoanaerobaculia bacterium]
MPDELTKGSLRKFAEASREDYEELLESFVEIPSISAEKEREPDIRRMSELAVETIRGFGGEAEQIETAGYPIVFGQFRYSKSAPTVTVYNHMDVQPASVETEPWETEPFEFTKKGKRYFGRGTTDDKGPALSVLYGIKAAVENDLPVNINLLWELEEEIGSPSFEKALKQHSSRFRTDSVIVSDTIWVSRDKPACPAGLRGMQAFEFVLETGKTDIHSGTTGGLARNPLGELLKMLAEMHDPRTGRVRIKGFYDDVKKLSRKELDDFRSSGFSVAKFKRAHRVKSVRTEDPLDAMKRLWAEPTFEVHGLVGGYTGPGIKTIIPPKAVAKVSCRLVPDQDPKKILKLIREWVKERYPEVKIVPENRMEPYFSPIEGPLPDAVRRSMKFAFGKDPAFVREGGSIGAVPSMEKVLDCPVVFLGLSLPEHGYHAPNENFDWDQASGGMIAFAKYFEEIAKSRGD